MKSLIALFGMLTLASAANAAQLPSQTLFVKPTTLDRQMPKGSDGSTFVAYIAYTADPTTSSDDGDGMGGGIQAMTEDVAATLKGMTVDHVYKCDAHVWQTMNQFQLFQLNNCK